MAAGVKPIAVVGAKTVIMGQIVKIRIFVMPLIVVSLVFVRKILESVCAITVIQEIIVRLSILVGRLLVLMAAPATKSLASAVV